MITLTFISSLRVILIVTLNYNTNPLRISIKLVIITLLLFTSITIQSSRWYPIIIIILILGGILVIFTILSSLIPNEKINKEKKKIIILRLRVIYFSMIPKISTTNVYKMNKSYLEETPIFIITIIFMLFYFFRFISIISQQEVPIRQFECS